jgi:hypothetical protein
MLRHATGFKLTNDGADTRSLQAYLGYKDIQHPRATRRCRRRGSKTLEELIMTRRTLVLDC